ncbi:MAG: hypothetical protein ACLUI0_00430 [Blautia massiliensis (ex Durand et al. 2017)]
MIHNHSSGKHRLWRKILAVCIAFAMICSVSISAFAVEASSETANENTETVQSGSAEEAEELTATEAENDQSVDGSQSEEPVVTTGDENTEEPTDVIEAPSEDPEQPEEPSVEPGEDNESARRSNRDRTAGGADSHRTARRTSCDTGGRCRCIGRRGPGCGAGSAVGCTDSAGYRAGARSGSSAGTRG